MIMESMTNDVDATKNVLARELWREYEDNASLEANLVKDFDKVEMILQALEYETYEFFLSTAEKFQTEIGKSWAAEINSRRNSRLAKKLN
ncbi:hypothetical protein LXL04_000011 [Taraxacum kok-saghyz]